MQHRITGPGDISGRSLSLQELDQQDQKSDSMTESGAGENLPKALIDYLIREVAGAGRQPTIVIVIQLWKLQNEFWSYENVAKQYSEVDLQIGRKIDIDYDMFSEKKIKYGSIVLRAVANGKGPFLL